MLLQTLPDSILVTSYSIITSHSFYAIIIAYIASNTTIKAIRVANLGKRYKQRVVSNLRRNKAIEKELSNTKNEVKKLKSKLEVVEKVIQKHKLDKQFGGII